MCSLRLALGRLGLPGEVYNESLLIKAHVYHDTSCGLLGSIDFKGIYPKQFTCNCLLKSNNESLIGLKAVWPTSRQNEINMSQQKSGDIIFFHRYGKIISRNDVW